MDDANPAIIGSDYCPLVGIMTRAIPPASPRANVTALAVFDADAERIKATFGNETKTGERKRIKKPPAHVSDDVPKSMARPLRGQFIISVGSGRKFI